MRASAGRSAIANRTSPLNARSRSRPFGDNRALERVIDPIPVSSRSDPETSVPSIGPRRTSAESVPRKALNVSLPSTTCTRSTTASRGTRTTISARTAGSVAPAACTARTWTRAGDSSIVDRQARQILGDGA